MMPSGSSAARLLELHTRFLYPFFFAYEQDAVRRAEFRQRVRRRLDAVRVQRRDGSFLPVWTCPAAPDLYTEEVLPHVREFLFESASNDSASLLAACQYFQVSDAVANRWFDSLELRHDRLTLRLRSSTPARAELFLCDYGVGILSLAFVPTLTSPGFDGATSFNYLLSQLRAGTCPHLGAPLPAAGEGQARSAEPALHGSSSGTGPLLDRLGRRGELLTLRMVIDALLSPLEVQVRPAQDQLSVYTVARFDETVDFDRPEARAALGPFLSRLAQVEERTHAEVSAGDLGVINRILNRKHWAAVGLLGAAHLVADQEGDVQFNAARLPRIFLKYFVPHALAMLQQLTLHSILQQAAGLAPSDGAADGVEGGAASRVRRRLLEFGVRGHFVQVSSRQALHQYYRIAQQALNIPEVLVDARQAIADLEARSTTSVQLKLADDTARTMRQIKRLQETLEGVEVIIAGLTAATVGDLLTRRFPMPEWISRVLPRWLRDGLHALTPLLDGGPLHWAVVLASGIVGFLAMQAWLRAQARKDA